MKKLNITKEQFNRSNYFQKKYGKLEYVSESGKLFKTDKGKVLKFNESVKSTENFEEKLVSRVKELEEELYGDGSNLVIEFRNGSLVIGTDGENDEVLEEATEIICSEFGLQRESDEPWWDGYTYYTLVWDIEKYGYPTGIIPFLNANSDLVYGDSVYSFIVDEMIDSLDYNEKENLMKQYFDWVKA